MSPTRARVSYFSENLRDIYYRAYMITTGRVGRAVAVVSGGAHDGTIIRLLTSEGKKDAEVPRRDLHEVLDESDFIIDPKKYRMLPLADRVAIMQAIQNGEFDEEEDEGDSSEEEVKPKGRQVQRRVAKAYQERSKFEYRLDDGKMVVLPSKETERVFVAGKSGSGKSYFTAFYMREYLEIFPDRKIYLFSTHDGERAYENIDHTAMPLDEGFAENPPALEDLSNSLCVFDDCDNLQDKKIAKACDKLNADLICNGRKHDIHVVTLAHQLMEYQRTRGQLNEANRVVFFPQGSQYHNQRFLKVYAGLGGDWVKHILNEKSRWICLDTRVPMSYVTENAVVVIRQLPKKG